MLFPDYLASSLDDESRIKVEDHLNSCSQCREEFERFRPVFGMLQDGALSPPPENYFVNLLPRVRRRLDVSENRFPLFSPVWTRWLAPLTALAVTIILVFNMDLTGSVESNGLHSLAGTMTAEELADAFVLQAQQGFLAPSATVSGAISDQTVMRELFVSILDEESIYDYVPLEALPELGDEDVETVLRRLKERTML